MLRLIAPLLFAFAILGGYVQAVWVLGLDPGHYWSALQGSVSLGEDYAQAFVKSAVFGAVLSLISTYAGYHAPPTIEGTSRATTDAVVQGSLMILFLDFLLSALFY